MGRADVMCFVTARNTVQNLIDKSVHFAKNNFSLESYAQAFAPLDSRLEAGLNCPRNLLLFLPI